MWFGIITLFPEMFQAVSSYGVTGRAVDRSLLELAFWDPRDYTKDLHRSVDDRPYGGGPGMVMKVEPIQGAIKAAKLASGGNPRVICLSPQGRRINQQDMKILSKEKQIILLAGRYEGIDQRLFDLEIDDEWSIGDYVLSGGELAAMVIIDGVTRLIPGVLNNNISANQDSFMHGLLDCPHYTRPESINNLTVPEVLLSGDHKQIKDWRLKQQLGRTWLQRPDLLQKIKLDELEQQLLHNYIEERKNYE